MTLFNTNGMEGKFLSRKVRHDGKMWKMQFIMKLKLELEDSPISECNKKMVLSHLKCHLTGGQKKMPQN